MPQRGQVMQLAWLSKGTINLKKSLFEYVLLAYLVPNV